MVMDRYTRFESGVFGLIHERTSAEMGIRRSIGVLLTQALMSTRRALKALVHKSI